MSRASSTPDERSALIQRLMRFLEERTRDLDLEIELRLDTRILATGVLDSLALVELTLWVEEEIGMPIDPATFDLSREWATIADIAAFIEQNRRGAADATRRARPTGS